MSSREDPSGDASRADDAEIMGALMMSQLLGGGGDGRPRRTMVLLAPGGDDTFYSSAQPRRVLQGSGMLLGAGSRLMSASTAALSPSGGPDDDFAVGDMGFFFRSGRSYESVTNLDDHDESGLRSPTGAATSDGDDADPNGWACTDCTFVNSARALRCEICAAMSPSMSAVAAVAQDVTTSRTHAAGETAPGAATTSERDFARSTSPVLPTEPEVGGSAPRRTLPPRTVSDGGLRGPTHHPITSRSVSSPGGGGGGGGSAVAPAGAAGGAVAEPDDVEIDASVALASAEAVLGTKPAGDYCGDVSDATDDSPEARAASAEARERVGDDGGLGRRGGAALDMSGNAQDTGLTGPPLWEYILSTRAQAAVEGMLAVPAPFTCAMPSCGAVNADDFTCQRCRSKSPAAQVWQRATSVLFRLRQWKQLSTLMTHIIKMAKERDETDEWVAMQGHAECDHAAVLIRMSKPVRANKACRRALETAHRFEKSQFEGLVHGNLGLAFESAGKFELAMEHYQTYLEIARARLGADADTSPFVQAQADNNERRALSGVGALYQRLGQLDAAVDAHRQARAIAQRIGDVRAEATACGDLGWVYLTSGDDALLAAALEQHSECLRLVLTLGGDVEEADMASREDGSVFDDPADVIKVAAFISIAASLAANGEQARALDHVAVALDSARGRCDFHATLAGMAVRADILARMGDLPAAARTLERYVRIANRKGMRAQHCFGKLRLAETRTAQARRLRGGRRQRMLRSARSAFESAVRVAEALGDASVASDAHAGAGSVCKDLGDTLAAVFHMKQLVESRQTAGDTLGHASAMTMLGQLQAERGLSSVSVDCFNSAITSFSTARRRGLVNGETGAQHALTFTKLCRKHVELASAAEAAEGRRGAEQLMQSHVNSALAAADAGILRSVLDALRRFGDVADVMPHCWGAVERNFELLSPAELRGLMFIVYAPSERAGDATTGFVVDAETRAVRIFDVPRRVVDVGEAVDGGADSADEADGRASGSEARPPAEDRADGSTAADEMQYLHRSIARAGAWAPGRSQDMLDSSRGAEEEVAAHVRGIHTRWLAGASALLGGAVERGVPLRVVVVPNRWVRGVPWSAVFAAHEPALWEAVHSISVAPSVASTVLSVVRRRFVSAGTGAVIVQPEPGGVVGEEVSIVQWLLSRPPTTGTTEPAGAAGTDTPPAASVVKTVVGSAASREEVARAVFADVPMSRSRVAHIAASGFGGGAMGDAKPAPVPDVADSEAATHSNGAVVPEVVVLRGVGAAFDATAAVHCLVGGGPAMRLAHSLLLSGSTHVLLPLWSVAEPAPCLLMLYFYRELSRMPSLDAPCALRRAQRWLRASTAGELTDFLQDLDEERADEMGDDADDIFHAIRALAGYCAGRELAKTDRPFSSPVYWAGYVAVGL